MSKVNLLISIDENYIDKMPEVVENLQSVGLQVEQSMQEVGVVTGSCEQAKVAAISQVEGVSEVETERQYQIAPPNSNIQ
jgi:hypothetical protein